MRATRAPLTARPPTTWTCADSVQVALTTVPGRVAAERGDGGNRTHDGGFADLCLTTWLRRPVNDFRRTRCQGRHLIDTLCYRPHLDQHLLRPQLAQKPRDVDLDNGTTAVTGSLQGRRRALLSIGEPKGRKSRWQARSSNSVELRSSPWLRSAVTATRCGR
jgi:hypothetical protein